MRAKAAPFTHRDAGKADKAFAAHSALLRLEAARPDLKDNPFWIVLRQDAYENFVRALDGGAR